MSAAEKVATKDKKADKKAEKKAEKKSAKAAAKKADKKPSAGAKSAGTKSASDKSSSDKLGKDDKNAPDIVPPIGVHGAAHLPGIEVKGYNLEIKDKDGFVGDKASGKAFRAFLRDWRVTLQEMGKDPFEVDIDTPISKKQLDKFLAAGDVDAAAVVHGAVEDFAKNLAHVVAKFMTQKSWADTSSIVVGGGLSEARVGELAIARAGALLQADGIEVELRAIRHHPDEAGLIGCLHLAPAWIFTGYHGIIAVDIGGSNIRCGVVAHNVEKDKNLKRAAVGSFDLWKHANEEKLDRDAAIARLVKMIRDLLAKADAQGLVMAPFIGIACPGLIQEDGSIKRGAQNLPGDWEEDGFCLPEHVRKQIGTIGKHEPMVVMHNDAVIQGLSERPWMTKTADWAVLTIGTGLGNASYRTKK